jgi:hypothetical protein
MNPILAEEAASIEQQTWVTVLPVTKQYKPFWKPAGQPTPTPPVQAILPTQVFPAAQVPETGVQEMPTVGQVPPEHIAAALSGQLLTVVPMQVCKLEFPPLGAVRQQPVPL